MDFTRTRREIMFCGAIGIVAPASGCSSNLSGNRSPSSLGVRTGNSTDKKLTTKVQVKSSNSEVVWEETFIVPPNAEVRRETDLQGNEYDLTIVTHPDDEANMVEYNKHWQWQGCDEDYIMIQISNSGVDVSSQCFDD